MPRVRQVSCDNLCVHGPMVCGMCGIHSVCVCDGAGPGGRRCVCGVMGTERVRSILDEELRAAIFNTYLPPPPALLTQSSVQAHRTL